MTWVAGADGCRTGWVRVSLCIETRSLRADVVARANELLSLAPQPELLCIDIPIGLPDRGPRACDLESRRLLGQPRGSSVFPAPVRSVVRLRDYAEACSRHERVDGRRLSRQAFAILPKIAEVDDWLVSSPEARSRVYEVHPEVCFTAIAGRPIAESKKRRPGRECRRSHLTAWLGQGVLAAAYQAVRGKGPAEDDFLDACAAVWSAQRIRVGGHRVLPPKPPVDSLGLPMQIVY